MGVIKDIKNKVTQGHSVVRIGWEQDDPNGKTYEIEFSDGDVFHAYFAFESAKYKKFKNFIYLTYTELERKAKEESGSVCGDKHAILDIQAYEIQGNGKLKEVDLIFKRKTGFNPKNRNDGNN